MDETARSDWLARRVTPTETRFGLFTRAEALSRGVTDRRLRSGEFGRVLQGVYCPGDKPIDHELRCHAAALVLPPSAVLTGRSAATLHGVPLAKTWDHVEALVSGAKYMNRRKGLRCWSVRSRPAEHRPWHGIRLATPLRTAFDLLARKPLRQAVASCDAMLHACVIQLPDLVRFLAGRSDRGITRARIALQHLDARSESVPESELRLLLNWNGFPVEPQVQVHDEFGFVARVDLALRSRKVAIEYDGAWHGNPAQFARDRIRQQRLERCGWTVVVVTAKDLYGSPDDVVANVHQAARIKA
ncbi:DUF559 domain-containing protein [Allosaccharopolyspora coralli]|uniref:DUF559 domain-containing protein n=1 Tax=Allosaccharopolyspora coralli TaxID=2665642 RepID=A0A5Q3QC83_9PSEU|nr:DUF559 domain-containing protein [Allosaccharopolyspora coralli]QGK71500.1 DUF559 domain-containing protein [Allosaccharopolyspora coralli]